MPRQKFFPVEIPSDEHFAELYHRLFLEGLRPSELQLINYRLAEQRNMQAFERFFKRVRERLKREAEARFEREFGNALT